MRPQYERWRDGIGPKEDAVKRILVATDGSDLGHKALEFGLDFAEQDAWAFVVHVAPAVCTHVAAEAAVTS
jgi:nucleotide-binding universal stress UspA family protein